MLISADGELKWPPSIAATRALTPQDHQAAGTPMGTTSGLPLPSHCFTPNGDDGEAKGTLQAAGTEWEQPGRLHPPQYEVWGSPALHQHLVCLIALLLPSQDIFPSAVITLKPSHPR